MEVFGVLGRSGPDPFSAICVFHTFLCDGSISVLVFVKITSTEVLRFYSEPLGIIMLPTFKACNDLLMFFRDIPAF